MYRQTARRRQKHLKRIIGGTLILLPLLSLSLPASSPAAGPFSPSPKERLAERPSARLEQLDEG
jgi:hypothetical protein